MGSSSRVLCALVLLCLVVVAPHAEAAISCGVVISKLGPCTSYLKGGAGPSGDCCGGVKALAGLATTTPDRKVACTCLKSAAGSITGLNLGNAAALPGKCGVKVPYAISPHTDCSTVS